MKRNIKLLALHNFFTDFQLFSAILVLYFAKVTGSYALAMSVFSVAMLASSVFEVPTGIFSDRIGRKKTVLLGSVSATISIVLYAIGGHYWILLVGAIFEGLSRAWYSGNNDALLHDSLRELGKHEAYDHYLGKLSSMFQLALAAGAAIGSVLAAKSFAIVMWASVIPQILCIIVACFLIEPKKITTETSNVFSHFHTALKLFWTNKTLRLLSLQDIISYGLGESSFQFRSAFVATLWPLWAVGFSKMFSFIGGTISFWFSGAIIKRIGGYRVLLFSRLYNRAINFISLLFPSVISPALMASTSLWYGVTSVSTNALMQKLFTHSQRATMSSLNSLLGGIFFSICSIVVGLGADRFGPAQALLIIEVCSLSLVYITWKLTKRT
jgi:MFS family permease